MVSKALFTVVILLFSLWIVAFCHNNHFNPNGSHLAGIELPMPGHNNFNAISSSASSDCGLQTSQDETDLKIPTMNLHKETHDGKSVKFNLRHRLDGKEQMDSKDSVLESTLRDLNRIHTFHRRILEDKNQNSLSRRRFNNKRHLLEQKPSEASDFHGKLMGKLKSGVSSGSGEYFMDVLVGTPPKQYSLIVDTGSDLNWLQCLPCYDCFEQAGQIYDPKQSNSFQNITCQDSRCHHVSSPDPPTLCKAKNQSCPYFYWYGDSSNTTGDFALETFTVNITTSKGESEFKKLENVMFGCGHWNRGLFHGAAGLLGLGRGPLSFSSQIQAQYGHSFSYCLVDRYSGPNVSSKLIFGEDKDLLSSPGLNFTSLVVGKENPVDTFYYLEVKSVLVGGEELDIPEETWRLSDDGGGTIVDSGTTLSYFVEPAYKVIKEAFERKVKGSYPLVKDFPVLGPCYNVSGLEDKEKLELPGFGFRFKDGSQWNFPVDNHFIWVDQHVICLAFLSTPRNSFSIIGNYQQQNFHVMYDTKKSRLGFAQARCAEM